MSIEIGKVGQVIKGSQAGTYICVVDDADATGGYFVLVAHRMDMKDGFDDWVADWEGVEHYFAEAAWSVDWCPAAPRPSDTPDEALPT